MRRLVEWLLDPRCSNVLSFLDWTELSGRGAQEWMLPLFLEQSELVDWRELVVYYKSWQRELVDVNADRVDWGRLGERSHFTAGEIALIDDHPERVDWADVCRRATTALMPVFEKHIDLVQWESLLQSSKFNCFDRHPFMERNVERIGFPLLCTHPHKWMLSVFRRNAERLDWIALSSKAHVWMKPLFYEQADRVNWTAFCRHPRQEMLSIMQVFADRLDWPTLARNPRKWTISLFDKKAR